MKFLEGYKDFFQEVIDTINHARYEAFRTINKFHIGQNYEIGRIIFENQEKYQWGKSIVEALSQDISRQTDGAKGYSPQNLWKMRQFYLQYKEHPSLLNQALQIPWSHNILIFQQLKGNKEREYYLRSTEQMGWSRAVLLNQIKADAYGRQRLNPKLNNFEKALPAHLSEQANEALKSEYNLDFLGITKPILERELENRLIENIRDFLLELGYGFSFIGNQYRLKLNQKEYHVDLLFYHRFLKCLVAIELKTVEFEPEFAAKLNFYLELLDEQEKQADDNPSIGILLCPSKDHIEVEYALRSTSKPIGVTEYNFTHKLPEQLKGKMPSRKQLKQMLSKAMEENGGKWLKK